jgi:hypothetical protein
MKSILVTVTDGWSYRYLFCTGVYEYLKSNNKLTLVCSEYYFEKLSGIDAGNIEVKRIKVVKSQFINNVISAKNYVFRIYNNFKISKFYISKLKFHQKLLVKSLNLFILLFGHYILLILNFCLDYLISNSRHKIDDYSRFDTVLFLSPYSYEEVELSKQIKSKDIKKIFILPSWDNIYKYHLEDEYTKYIVWGIDQKTFLLSIGIPEAKILCLGGISQYIYNHKKTFSLYNNNQVNFRILYATVTERIFKNEFLFVKKLVTNIENGYYGNSVELLIRLHPADSFQKYDSLQSLKVQVSNKTTTTSLSDWNVQNDYFESQVADILSSSLIITVASTMTLDCILLDRLTINYRPDFCKEESDYYQFEHYASITNSGLLPILSSLDELNEYILDTINGINKYDSKLINAISSATSIHKFVDVENYFTKFLD